MSKYDEKFAEAWESLTDSQREEIAWSSWANRETKSQPSDSVLRLTCFILNIVTGFIGFVAGWWLV